MLDDDVVVIEKDRSETTLTDGDRAFVTVTKVELTIKI